MKQSEVMNSTHQSILFTGVESGQLDQALHKIALDLDYEVEKALTWLGKLLPLVAFLLVAALVIYHIFQIFGSYMNAFTELISTLIISGSD